MQHSEKFSALLCEVLGDNLNEKANDHSLGTATHKRGTIAGISPGPRRTPGSGAAGNQKIIDFQLKPFGKVSILSSGPGRERPGIEKSSIFN